MESNNNSLRQVLNSIASIHHELAKDQTQMPDSAIFVQLKNLAAQLYLESDIELLSLAHEEMQTQEEVAVNAPLGSANLFTQVDNPLEVVPTFIPEVESVVLEKVIEPIIHQETHMEVQPVEEIAPEVTPISVIEQHPETVVPVQESIEVTPEETSHTIESVIGQMPLSRRFEFSNILFGGDMQKMGIFIQQMIDAPNAAVRMDVYDQWYEEKQWRRRDESASDMLRMLKRIFTA